MKWCVKEISVGDMVRVPMSTAYHYGVCTGDDRIVQFGEPIFSTAVPPESVRVIATDIRGFIGKNSFAEVAVLDRKELKSRRSIAETVRYAEENLGRGGYNLLTNNCEHFANECLFGKHESSEIDSFRAKIENMLPRIDVYVARAQDFKKVKKLPKFLMSEIKSIKDNTAAEEKRAAYALLLRAAEEIYGKRPDLKAFYREASGKAVYPDFCFSLTHKAGLVAVAVSKVDVGVDIEEILPDTEALKSTVTDAEAAKSLPLRLLWTKKEAIYKLLDPKSPFVPGEIDTEQHATLSKLVSLESRDFFLSVSSKVLTNTRFTLLSDGLSLDEIK